MTFKHQRQISYPLGGQCANVAQNYTDMISGVTSDTEGNPVLTEKKALSYQGIKISKPSLFYLYKYYLIFTFLQFWKNLTLDLTFLLSSKSSKDKST